MFRLGLTGNIASGKSTVASLLASRGARVVDADVLAREAVAPGSPGLASVIAHFGPALLREDGTLDRGALRERVFADAAERRALEAIVHPEVARLRAERAATAERDGVEVLVDEIPLLFEVGLADSFDAVLFVDAPEAVRLSRLIERRGLPADDAQAMMAAQGAVEPKRRRATWVIDNAGSQEALAAAVDRVWTDIQRRRTLPSA